MHARHLSKGITVSGLEEQFFNPEFKAELLLAAVPKREEARKLIQSFVCTVEQSAELIEIVCRQDKRDHRLLVHWIFDRSRELGLLEHLIQQCRAGADTNQMLSSLLEQAQPKIQPVIVAHRAERNLAPENTLQAVKIAAAKGVEAIEIDLCLTADGEIVLWHDFSPKHPEALARSLEFEQGGRYKPTFPDLFSSSRRPVHRMKLSEFVSTHGYRLKKSESVVGAADCPPDCLRDVLKFLAEHDSPRLIMLDIKLPPHHRATAVQFSNALAKLLDETGMWNRVMLMHIDPYNFSVLKHSRLSQCASTFDQEIVSLFPEVKEFSAVKAARHFRNSVASIGRPILSVHAFERYAKILAEDRANIAQLEPGARLFSWTINDELEFRELLAIGVDGIITDQSELMRSIVESVFKAPAQTEKRQSA